MKRTIWYKEYFLPTKQHRKRRVRNRSKEMEFSLTEPSEFPLAFVVTDSDWRYEEGEAIFGNYDTEYRVYEGKLYAPLRASCFVCKADGWATEENLLIENRKPWEDDSREFTDASVIVGNTLEQEVWNAENRAKQYLSYDGKIWGEIGEPMYSYRTFGLGHNHGGTGFFIDNHYNPNISHKCYFSALEREKAIETAVETALGRGDTESVDSIRNTEKNIKILMPEMVKRNPVKEHGDGDEFLNEAEALVSASDSVTEAGLLVFAKALSEM